MKIVAVNDIHKSAVPPASRKANYNACINAKLAELATFCNDNAVDYLLITGDWYHSVLPERVPYWLVGESANILRMFKCKKIAALGNHDWDEVPQRLPYFPIFYTYLVGEVKFNVTSGYVCSGISVINSDIGSSADDVIETMKTVAQGVKVPDNALGGIKNIICYHGPIVRPDLSSVYPSAFMDKAVDPRLLDGLADYIFYGDIHDPHGAYKLGSTTFVNYGSLARNSAKELKNERPVCAAYLDTESTDGPIPVALESVVPAAEAFRSEDIAEEKRTEAELDNFVASLGSTNFSVLTPEVLIARIKASFLNPEEQIMAVNVVKRLVG